MTRVDAVTREQGTGVAGVLTRGRVGAAELLERPEGDVAEVADRSRADDERAGVGHGEHSTNIAGHAPTVSFATAPLTAAGANQQTTSLQAGGEQLPRLLASHFLPPGQRGMQRIAMVGGKLELPVRNGAVEA